MLDSPRVAAATLLALTVCHPSPAQLVTRLVPPADTDPEIGPVDLPNADDQTPLDHLVVVNPDGPQLDRLLLWLAGTGGAPAQYRLFSETAAGLGYDVAGLVYDSWPAVNGITTNSTDPDLPEAIRRERLFGEDLVPDPIDVDPANSVLNRTVKLLEHQLANHPDEGWDRYLTDDGGVDWSRVVVAGHSQGAGHAAYLSKEFELAGAIMIAGPGDFVQELGVAPWVSSVGETPARRLFALTHVDDPTAAGFFTTQRILGLDAFGQLQNVDGKPAEEITSHMLTSLLDPGHTNYHSAVAVDELVPLDDDGTPLYEAAWTSLLLGAAAGPGLPGDADADGDVDGDDLIAVQANFATVGAPLGDADFDNDVDGDDLIAVQNAFAAGEPAAVPEPTTAALWCLGTSFALGRRHAR